MVNNGYRDNLIPVDAYSVLCVFYTDNISRIILRLISTFSIKSSHIAFYYSPLLFLYFIACKNEIVPKCKKLLSDIWLDRVSTLLSRNCEKPTPRSFSSQSMSRELDAMSRRRREREALALRTNPQRRVQGPTIIKVSESSRRREWRSPSPTSVVPRLFLDSGLKIKPACVWLCARRRTFHDPGRPQPAVLYRRWYRSLKGEAPYYHVQLSVHRRPLPAARAARLLIRD